MKKQYLYRYAVGIVWLTMLLTSCKKYEDFQTNPNLPSTGSPALLLTRICYSVFYYDNTSAAFFIPASYIL